MSDSRIQLYSGTIFDPLAPDPQLIEVEDIAHSLALQCRFSGHTFKFYSVAEHSVRVSHCFDDPHLALWGLLHDASEAYLVDVPSPLKNHKTFGSGYRAAERRLMRAVAVRFNLSWPMPDEVKKVDRRLLVTERRDLLSRVGSREERDLWTPWLTAEPLLGVISPWSSTLAKIRFLKALHDLQEES